MELPSGLPLRFHWGPPSGEDADFAGFCNAAEEAGVESVEIPLSVAESLASKAGGPRFRLVCGAGDIERARAIPGRRPILHLKEDDDPFAFAALPGIEIEGESAEAAFFAIKYAGCLWRLPDRPSQVYADALPILHFGKDVGLVASVVARPTREHALDAARSVVTDDPSCWITASLWRKEKKAVFVGSFDDVAEAIRTFHSKGISHLLLRDCELPVSVIHRVRDRAQGRLAVA